MSFYSMATGEIKSNLINEVKESSIVTRFAKNTPFDVATLLPSVPTLESCICCANNNSILGKSLNLSNIKGMIKGMAGDMLSNAFSSAQALAFGAISSIVSKISSVVTGALDKVLAKLVDAVGDVRGTLEGLANKLYAAMEDPWNFADGLITSGLGGLLGNAARSIMNKAFGLVDKFKKAVSGAVAGFIGKLNDKLAAFGIGLLNPILSSLSKLTSFLAPISGFLSGKFGSLSATLADLKSKVFARANGFLSSIGGLAAEEISKQINKATASFSVARSVWTKYIDDGIQFKLGDIKESINLKIRDLAKKYFDKLKDKIKSKVSGLISKFANKLMTKINEFKDYVNSKLDKLKNRASKLNDLISGKLNGLRNKVMEKLSDGVAKIAGSNCCLHAILGDLLEGFTIEGVAEARENLACIVANNAQMANLLNKGNIKLSKDLDNFKAIGNLLSNSKDFNKDCVTAQAGSKLDKVIAKVNSFDINKVFR